MRMVIRGRDQTEQLSSENKPLKAAPGGSSVREEKLEFYYPGNKGTAPADAFTSPPLSMTGIQESLFYMWNSETFWPKPVLTIPKISRS